MSFLRRKKPPDAAPPPVEAVYEDISAQSYALKLNFIAKSSDGLRLPPDPRTATSLPGIVEPLSQTPVEVVEPLPLEYSDAAPAIERFTEVQQWVLARRGIGPIGRHGLYVLEITDALDMTVDTFICGLLHGEIDTSGYPDYNAIVGGLASHWDELSGELIVRAVVGWGGRGLRGDTERIGQKLLSSLYQQVVASGFSLGAAEQARLPAPGSRSGLTCPHCGFESSSAGAFYCPKCGMRMVRS
ncbi:MAG: zinc ribbon domain-containing protein [Chloroflexota bacterium]